MLFCALMFALLLLIILLSLWSQQCVFCDSAVTSMSYQLQSSLFALLPVCVNSQPPLWKHFKEGNVVFIVQMRLARLFSGFFTFIITWTIVCCVVHTGPWSTTHLFGFSCLKLGFQGSLFKREYTHAFWWQCYHIVTPGSGTCKLLCCSSISAPMHQTLANS